MNKTPRAVLRQKKVRPTKYRLAVLEEIMLEKHPSASEIYAELLLKWPKISRTTVYNTLNVLVQENVIEELNVDMIEARYDIFYDHYHGHFYCDTCRKLYDFPLTHTLGKVRELQGFEAHSYRVYLRGTCKDCIEKENSKKS